MYIIYALKLADGDIYVGMTNDFERRIKEHEVGKTKFTRNKKIVDSFILERCDDRLTARAREKYWKSGCGKEQLKYMDW